MSIELPGLTVATKADAVFLRLREELLGGVHLFGATLSSAGLALRLGVSRRPVMDALARLESAGFIEIIPQVGCRVVVPDRKDLQEHFQMASVLDGGAARLAAVRATAEDRAELRLALELGGVAAAANDAERWAEANKRFHAAILDASGNRRIFALAQGAWDLSDFYLQRRPRADLPRSQEEHEGIAAAIERKEADRARSLMEAHLVRFGDEAVLPQQSKP